MKTAEVRFVPITEDYINNPELIVRNLKFQEGVYLCGRESFGSLDRNEMNEVKVLRKNKKDIIVLNMYVNPRKLPYRIQSREFIFCSYCNSCSCAGIMENRHALVVGNYFLCKDMSTREDEEESVEEIPGGQALSVSFTHEYACHTDLNNRKVHTRYPAYVNLDRSSDNIGMSSWDGNLTRWMKAGFTTRIQYAVHAGLFPEE